MIELNSHTLKATPPPRLIPLVLKLKDTYGIWQQYVVHFPKANRFTLGAKIDDIFLSSIEYGFLASYSTGTEKLHLINRCIARIDLLKLLLQLSWEIHALDDNKYGHLSRNLAEIGKMLGGWRRQTVQKTPE
jgi:hypothetical protein